MALVRWDPTRELASMEVDRLNRMFNEFFGERFSGGWVPPVDIYESDSHEIVIKAEVPDIKREDISVTFENNVLTLSGERKAEHDVRDDRYQRRERHFGTFSRSFTLPATVDGGRISASYKEGMLTIRLPQREEAKPKQIAIGE